jgi:hypothetical protein
MVTSTKLKPSMMFCPNMKPTLPLSSLTIMTLVTPQAMMTRTTTSLLKRPRFYAIATNACVSPLTKTKTISQPHPLPPPPNRHDPAYVINQSDYESCYCIRHLMIFEHHELEESRSITRDDSCCLADQSNGWFIGSKSREKIAQSSSSSIVCP